MRTNETRVSRNTYPGRCLQFTGSCATYNGKRPLAPTHQLTTQHYVLLAPVLVAVRCASCRES